jgi:hypothetical protein
MTRTSTTLFLVLALAPAAAPAAACLGPNPAITHVAVQSTSSSGGVNRYHIVGAVTNLGTTGQPSNVLQFVDIYDAQTMTKLDSRGISPLSVGATVHFTYDWKRSSEAQAGSSTLLFRMNMVQGSNCSPANGALKLTL